MGHVAGVVQHREGAEHVAKDLEARAWLEGDQAMAGHLEHVGQAAARDVTGDENRAAVLAGRLETEDAGELDVLELGEAASRARAGGSRHSRTPDRGETTRPARRYPCRAARAHRGRHERSHVLPPVPRGVLLSPRASFPGVESRSDHTHRPTGPATAAPDLSFLTLVGKSLSVRRLLNRHRVGCAPLRRDRTQPCNWRHRFVIG